MDDLVAWLRAQLNEDERVAREATDGPWRVNNEDYAETIYSADDSAVVAGGRWGGEASVFNDTADALHISLHDPARVLREVESKRAILAALPADDGYDAGRVKFANYESCDDSCVGMVMHEVVKLIALPYADRSGYQESWRP